MPQTTIYAAPRTREQTPPPAVATHQLARLFGRSAALAGVSMRVETGSTVALLGPNGAGKTTLLRILATSLRPTFGSAEVGQVDVASHPELVRPRVAYLSHATALYDDLTAAENLAFAAAMRGLGSPSVGARAALDEVGLTLDADRRAGAFSAGMRRRLALGRLLLGTPSLVLLDEPHAALDADGMLLVDRLMERWRAERVTVVVASHQAERVLQLADGWASLESGLLVSAGGTGVSVLDDAPAGVPAAAVRA
ncbi:MAG TPA: heme ABC exporter ATP-binding protein CcmA [Candidatus Limnocylindria bacterium]|nr:heme ABC exporter ATP-binding protein CcmA [Candidatus Limnocylindria bacterium]